MKYAFRGSRWNEHGKAVSHLESKLKQADVQCCDTLQKQGTDVVLLNTAVDGVSCESHFCRHQISSFLYGKSNILGLVDPNHNAKNSRYQMFVGHGQL
eukprot:scaffold5622_cov70-Attheya_sp.AAC.1